MKSPPSLEETNSNFMKNRGNKQLAPNQRLLGRHRDGMSESFADPEVFGFESCFHKKVEEVHLIRSQRQLRRTIRTNTKGT